MELDGAGRFEYGSLPAMAPVERRLVDQNGDASAASR